MKRRIRWSPAAAEDMEGVWNSVFAVSRDLETTERYVLEFIGRIGKLEDFPTVGFPMYYRGLFTGFWSVNYKAYKAFYRIRGEYVDIIRILPAGSDYLKVIFREEDPTAD